MSWNYRVIRRTGGYGCGIEGKWVSFCIHEVYYTKRGRPKSWSEDPQDPHGETLEELRDCLNMMLAALDKPVLEERGNKLAEVKEEKG